ncbi:MAG: Mov34/MPN/PAD-1 family protein [Candidatus Poribacteria bacterium]|nr:Mov34/MPN/PAD-1 family protein [Candidatus Poribacteria bacterium]
MSDEFCELNGEVLSSNNLSISKARDFASAVVNSDYARLVECKCTTSDSEIIVFDTKVQVGQKTVYDIRKYERLSVVFESSDAVMPEVLALRKDFPRVPHINLRSEEFPRSLCITEQQYSEWRLQYTGASLLEDIRQWLTLTAKDTLHADDQPLEPLFAGSRGELILPSDFITNTADSELLSVTFVGTGNRGPVFIAKRLEVVDEKPSSVKYVATFFKSTPQPHGIVRSAPADLLELHDYLNNQGNINLIPKLRSRFIEWKDKHKEIDILEAQLALVICLPKTRNRNLVPEEPEFCAFLTGETIRKIGIEIGLWAYRDRYPRYFDLDLHYLVPIDWSKKGNNIQIVMLNTHFHFSRELGTYLNGLSQKVSRKITAVGLGALGSQVFMNMIRAGQGEWTLIDKDILLPHNLARHALDGFSVGYPKVDTLAVIANKTVDGNPIANSIVADILNPVEAPETLKKIKEAFNTADIILDVSASIAVARYLVHDVDSPTRRISLFLNPVGTDVTVLAEDSERKTTLDSLEMQYYRHVINEDCLEGLLQMEPEHFRYSNSCSDVSATIPQDFVAMHAAICSRTIYQLTSNKQPLLSIWRIDADQFSVQKYSFPVKKTIEHKKGKWRLFTDEGFIKKIYEERAKKLPNETGGVLIGSYDMQRKIVYVVDYLPSPPDSKEWPTHYIRGCQGLRSKIEKIQQSTTNRIKYVGEWHSHPPNCGVKPSQDDRKVFEWISDFMTVEGLPPLMLIVGDHEKYAFYLEEID